MMMPGRKYQTGSGYRYGFNGKENDNEVKGEGNQQDYGMRIYDPRLGRFLSVDPLEDEYPELTPYQFAGNTPIQATDLDGEEPSYHYEDGKGRIVMMPAGDNLPRRVPVEHLKFLPQSTKGEPGLMDPATSAILDNIPFIGTAKAVIEGVVGTDAAGNKLSKTERVVGLVPFLGKAKKTLKVFKAFDKINDTKKLTKSVNKVDDAVSTERAIVNTDPTKRVTLRKDVKQKIQDNQPRNDKGQMIDPNTNLPLDPKKTDIGHIPGEEWKKRKKMHQDKGSTRKDVIIKENNPDLYQLEDRSSNRSHKHEKKN